MIYTQVFSMKILLLVLAAVGAVKIQPTTGPTNVTTSAKPILTGIPQIDYIHDPNLPFQLRGYNLSDYPFYNSMPKNITFKCDGLKDGFYASKPHKCQVYHHCLFGVRYDFLCANFTAFDQKIFNCHFVSEVDCENSDKYWSRNDDLYKPATTTTTTTAGPPERIKVEVNNRPGGRRRRPGRRRPYRRRPYYDDYYYDDYYYDDYQQDYDYYDYGGRKGRRKGRRRPGGGAIARPKVEPVVARDPQDTSRKALFSRARPAPLIKPPVPRTTQSENTSEPPKSKTKINLEDIPLDNLPIPIDENLVKEPEVKDASPAYYDDYTEEPLQQRQTVTTEKVVSRHRINTFRRYPSRKAVRTTQPPDPQPVQVPEVPIYDDYTEYAEPTPPRRKNRRRQGGYRGGFRRRPFRGRGRLQPVEIDYPDTQSASSFTEEDLPPVQRTRENTRRDNTYEEITEAPVPQRQKFIPPRHLALQPKRSRKPVASSPRERFPSRRQQVHREERPVVEYAEEPVVSEYTEEPLVVEEEITTQRIQNGGRHRSRFSPSRGRTNFYNSESRPSSRRNSRRYQSPQTPTFAQNVQEPLQEQYQKDPEPTQPPKKKGTPIRFEDIVFEEVPIAVLPPNYRAISAPNTEVVTFSQSPKRSSQKNQHPDELATMPLDELSKFTPAINKRMETPGNPHFNLPQQQAAIRPSRQRTRPLTEYFNPRPRPERDPVRTAYNNEQTQVQKEMLDQPVSQVSRSRSHFPESPLFESPSLVQSPPEETNSQNPSTYGHQIDRRHGAEERNRRRGSFRLRIPVRAPRKLVTGLFPHVEGL